LKLAKNENCGQNSDNLTVNPETEAYEINPIYRGEFHKAI